MNLKSWLPSRVARGGFVAAFIVFLNIWTASAQEQKISFELSVSGESFPTVSGTTAVADGTKLFVMLKKPWLPDAQQRVARGLPACEGDCFPALGPDNQHGAIAFVKQGRFSVGPFSFAGKPVKPGIYPIEIFVLPLDLSTATLAQIQAIKDPIFVSKVQIGFEPSAASLSERRPMHILRFNGRCDFTLPNFTQSSCDPKAMFMVLGNGRSALMFTSTARNENTTFALTGGHDRQPNAENYYLTVDTLRTIFADKQELITQVEGECHFNLNESGNAYNFVRCLIYNRGQRIVFKFNLNAITKTEIKSTN